MQPEIAPFSAALVNQMAKKNKDFPLAKCFHAETFSRDGGGVLGLCVLPQTRWKNKGGAEENQIRCAANGVAQLWASPPH